MSNYEIKDGEHGDEIWQDGERLCFQNESRNWQAAHGKSKDKSDAVAWYDGQRLEDAPGQPQPVTEYEAEVIEETVKDKTVEKAPERPVDPRINPIICPIAGSPQSGDKDPAVVAWWFKNHPEQAKNKYAGRRIKSESGIIV